MVLIALAVRTFFVPPKKNLPPTSRREETTTQTQINLYSKCKRYRYLLMLFYAKELLETTVHAAESHECEREE